MKTDLMINVKLKKQLVLFEGMAINKKIKKDKNIVTMIDLFAGIGGFHLAFNDLGMECVFASEWDEKTRETYKMNFAKDNPQLFNSNNFAGDITLVNEEDVSDFDILTAGFPCQPFSVAGYRQGFKDEGGRGNLFFDIVRILKHKKPKAFLLENVKNLKTHDKGNTMKIILDHLENKLNYHVAYKVLNTIKYGNIPQNRERIYIVGFLDKSHFENFGFPNKIPLTKTIHDCLEKNDVDDRYYYNDKPLYIKLKKDMKKRDTVYQWRRKYVRENKNGVCPTLTANMGMGGHNVPLVLNGKGIRKLTPRECANFQGFPDSFKLPTMADSHLYKQFGNSVSIPVIRRLAKKIKKALNN